jgi:predicted metal-dependent peptidase
VWAQARQDPEQAREVIRDVVQQAALAVGGDKVPGELQPALTDLGIGTAPGASPQDLQGGKRGRGGWRRRLRRYVGQALESRPVFTRPPRRFPDLVGVLPGRQRRPGRPKILAVIDTSGSVTAPLLEQISAELARLARHFEVTVAECDAEVQRVYDYRPLTSVCGRGGTDFRPPLESAFLRQHRPDLAIVFTDGMGPAPEHAPGPPLIWCLAPGGSPPADWGRVIAMEEP